MARWELSDTGATTPVNRGSNAMKSLILGTSGCLIALGLLATAGCGTNNESEAHKASQEIGSPGAPAAGKSLAGQNPAPPTSISDLTGRHQSGRQAAGQDGYPGANKKK
jgi:hypothetical protein